jgi:hypothetical protein
MKAVVVEKNEKEIVILDDKGCFQVMPNKGEYQVGDEIVFKPKKSFITVYFKQIAAMAAIFLFIIAGASYGIKDYYSPYAYVDIDINPSVELVLNKYMKVLEVQKLNQDADKIIKDSNAFKNKSVEQAVEMVLDNVQSSKIFKDGQENTVMYTVSSVNEKQLPMLYSKLQSISKKKLPKLLKSENIITEQVSLKKREEAKKLKLSPGRIVLFERLKQVKPDTKFEEVSKMPVKDTMNLIKQYKGEKALKPKVSKKLDAVKRAIEQKAAHQKSIQKKVEQQKEVIQKAKLKKQKIQQQKNTSDAKGTKSIIQKTKDESKLKKIKEELKNSEGLKKIKEKKDKLEEKLKEKIKKEKVKFKGLINKIKDFEKKAKNNK